MFIKFFVFLFAFINGYLTISIFSGIDFYDRSFFISALILSPVRFFIGMITFTTTFIAFSYIVRSLLEGTIVWINGVSNFSKALRVDYLLFISFLGLMKFSVLITLLLVIFSIIFGILPVDVRNSRTNDGDS